MSKAKQQGTKWEVELRDALRDNPGVHGAERLPEGGSRDQGDIAFSMDFTTWYVECKATQTLNVTRVLAKTREKSGDPEHTMLAWKRLTKLKEGQSRRTPDGEKVVIVMGLDTLMKLLEYAG